MSRHNPDLWSQACLFSSSAAFAIGWSYLGIHFQVADLRKTGRLDIIAPGKDGLYIFYNEGL